MPVAERPVAADCRRVPRRLLMTTDAVGGVWTYAVELSRALRSYDVEILLAVLGPSPSAAQRAEFADLPHVDVVEWSGRLEWMEDPWEDVASSGVWLLALARAFKPDVVHLNGYSHGALAWPAPTVVVGHSCVRSWWRAVRGEEPPQRLDRYTAMVHAGLRAASAVVVPSRAMRDGLERDYGPLPRPPQVVTNGRTAARCDVHCKEPFVLTAGRVWDAAKNIQGLEDVAARLPWPVCVAGEAGEAGEAAQPEGLTHTRRLGRLDGSDLAQWMARASIYVAPARYEPFGLSILEAAQAGCALVLGDIPSLRELWDDAAVYVAPDDRQGLCAALTTLIDQRSVREAMAARARWHARRYTPGRMAAGYVSLYTSLFSDDVFASPIVRGTAASPSSTVMVP
jgi:glycosyltransferase involved in cell wall biosynthesis